MMVIRNYNLSETVITAETPEKLPEGLEVACSSTPVNAIPLRRTGPAGEFLPSLHGLKLAVQ